MLGLSLFCLLLAVLLQNTYVHVCVWNQDTLLAWICEVLVSPQHEEELLYAEGGRALEQAAREGCGVPLSADIPNPLGTRSCATCSGWPCLALVFCGVKLQQKPVSVSGKVLGLGRGFTFESCGCFLPLWMLIVSVKAADYTEGLEQ